MINFIQSWGSLIISGLSLMVAVISYAKASESQQLQNRVNILELKIKQYEIEKISKEQAAANRACIEARVIKLGKNNYRLKVWNSGGADAYNVNIAADNSQEFIIINNDIEITILDIRGDQVKVGIAAPKEVPIYRKEVYLQIQEENKAATNTDGISALADLLKK